jgi:hypothetical protein
MRVALRWWIPRCGEEPSCSPVRRLKRPHAPPAMPRLKLTAQSDREPDTSSALASLHHSPGVRSLDPSQGSESRQPEDDRVLIGQFVEDLPNLLLNVCKRG